MTRPLLIFDGDCGFCRAWIARWRQWTGAAVDYAPYQEVADQFPHIPREAFDRAVHLVEPDGTVTRAAEAVLRALEWGGRTAGARCYRRSRWVRGLAEAAYAWVADHRRVLSTLTRALYGRDAARKPFARTSHVGLRALGLVYLLAFVSFWVQADGLVGARGLLPFGAWLEAIRPQVARIGYDRLPTLLWWWPTDAGLHVLCAAGTLGALALMAGLAPAVMAWLLWACFLSLVVVGQTFMGFQWENLLLEAGLISALAAPWRWRLRWGQDPDPPRLAVFLQHALVFKLMFLSGWVKLASHDTAWRDLTALTYHYWTQPLPTWTSWYAHQLPLIVQKACCLIMFVVELGLPFLIFMPRRLRHLAATGMVSLMVLIAATGNFAYFNVLTIVLCLWLWDDGVWTDPNAVAAARPAARTHQWVVGAVGALILLVSAQTMTQVLRWRVPWPGWVQLLDDKVAPLRSVNAYGLFAVMTKTRPELVVEGSRDGQTWLAYEFPWKPGDPGRRPRFVAPHQPRLDWQLWFAALGDLEGNPWVYNLMRRLLEGSPAVLRLVAYNPFPDEPPNYLRIMRYDYAFATPQEHRLTGAWWKRSLSGAYSPVLQRRAVTAQEDMR